MLLKQVQTEIVFGKLARYSEAIAATVTVLVSDAGISMPEDKARRVGVLNISNNVK